MAQAQNLHTYRPSIELRPKNPKYRERMYINGFLGFISTKYRNEMISHDGFEQIEYCAICGQEELSHNHLLRANPNGIK